MILEYLKEKNKDTVLKFIAELLDELEINYGIDKEIQENILERINNNGKI